MNQKLIQDWNDILAQTKLVWKELKDARIFITGGTGFFGNWLLDSFIWARQNLNLNNSVIVLTRDPERFKQKRPDLFEHPAIQFHQGDVRNFSYPAGRFSHVIHGATEASAQLNQDNPLLMTETIVEGTKAVLQFSRTAGVQKFLYISSGAVYGRQPAELSHIPEDYTANLTLSDPAGAYGIAKKTAELLCLQFYAQYNLPIKIARCFAFVGPYLPLDKHFAIGNFIRGALTEKEIILTGDGTAYRSYLYASELTVWLWHILCFGKTSRAYNVGSEQAVSILDLARLVAACFEEKIDINYQANQNHQNNPNKKPNHSSSRYIPCINRARQELLLDCHISLKEAILRTRDFYKDFYDKHY